LANAGIDLHAVLDTQLGVSVAEMNELLKTGEMTVDDLTDALQGFAEQYYGGAAEMLSKTLQGLENRFTTLKSVIMNDFVQPIVNQAIPAIETFFEGIAIVINTGVFEKLGELVTWTMRTIVGDVNWTAESVAETILEFILWLVQTSDKMLQYGYDMMTEWGYGMLHGAADAIKTVVKFISSTLSSLFSTHSPPAILPLIDVWGAGLIEAWLEGMSSADFSVINDIISPIKKAFQLMNLDDDVIYHNLQNIARLMADALGTDNLGEGLLGYIADITGPFGDAIAELTSLHFDLAEAIREVEEAQQALEDANDMYKEQDENVRRLVREYNDLLRAGASDDVLDAKLAELNTSIDQREEAEELIHQREVELDAAEENKDIIQDQVDVQTEMVNLMFDLVRGIEDAKDGAGDLADELGGALESLWGGLGELEFEEIEFSPVIQGLMDDIDAAIMSFKQSFRGLFDSLMAELGFERQLVNVEVDTEGGTVGHLESRWVKTGEGMFAGIGEAFKELMQTVIDIDWGELDWETFKGNFFTLVNSLFDREGDDWSSVKQTLRDALAGVLNELGLELDRDYTIGDVFKQVGEYIAEGIMDGIIAYVNERSQEKLFGAFSIWDILALVFNVGFGDKPETEVGEPIGEGILSGVWQSIKDGISETVTNIWDDTVQAFKIMLGFGSPSTVAAEDIGEPIGEGILLGILTNIIDNISTTATNVWNNISKNFDFFDDALSIGKNIMQGILDGISGLTPAGGWFSWAKGVVGNILGWLQDAGEEGSPSKLFAREVGAPFAQGILMGFKDEVNGMKKDMFTAVNSLMNYQPTPTNAYAPSAISTNNITYNMNMGNNVVRDDTDIALIVAANKRAIKQASYGA